MSTKCFRSARSQSTATGVHAFHTVRYHSDGSHRSLQLGVEGVEDNELNGDQLVGRVIAGGGGGGGEEGKGEILSIKAILPFSLNSETKRIFRLKVDRSFAVT